MDPRLSLQYIQAYYPGLFILSGLALALNLLKLARPHPSTRIIAPPRRAIPNTQEVGGVCSRLLAARYSIANFLRRPPRDVRRPTQDN